MFDDFTYSDQKELSRHGWIVRTAPGWPGVPGATWAREGVTFLKDEASPRNRILRMTSTTDGSSSHAAMAGPKAVRSMRAPREITSAWKEWTVILTPIAGPSEQRSWNGVD